MDAWWTYSPDDLLMFSARTYYRLLERHNAALWPAQLAALAAGTAIVALLLRRRAGANRAAAALVAAGWATVGWSWLALRFATIHYLGRWMAAAFCVEAALVAWTGVGRGRLGLAPRRDVATRAGRPWAQAETFALAPDPTVAASLGLLLAARAPWWLWPIPVAWSAFTGITLRAMQAPEWWVVPLAAFASVASGLVAWRRSRARA